MISFGINSSIIMRRADGRRFLQLQAEIVPHALHSAKQQARRDETVNKDRGQCNKT